MCFVQILFTQSQCLQTIWFVVQQHNVNWLICGHCYWQNTLPHRKDTLTLKTYFILFKWWENIRLFHLFFSSYTLLHYAKRENWFHELLQMFEIQIDWINNDFVTKWKELVSNGFQSQHVKIVIFAVTIVRVNCDVIVSEFLVNKMVPNNLR